MNVQKDLFIHGSVSYLHPLVHNNITKIFLKLSLGGILLSFFLSVCLFENEESWKVFCMIPLPILHSVNSTEKNDNDDDDDSD